MNSIWDYRNNLDYDKALAPNDPLWVPLNEARGEFNEKRILRCLGVDQEQLRFEQKRLYILFGGHRGCGKSTELRRLRQKLEGPEKYYVVFVDVLKKLDVNNMSYSDLLLAQTHCLIEDLEKQGVELDPIHLQNLNMWFKERIEQHGNTKELAAELKAGAKMEAGLPWLGQLFTGLTSTVKNNSTYKEEVRQVVRNSFSQFAQALNALLREAADKVKAKGLGKQILFIVDGTDRLSGENAKDFFIRDVHQLQQVEGCFVYCTPIDILTEDGMLKQNYNDIFRLPMVKLAEKGGGTPHPEARKILRNFILRRIPMTFFESEACIELLIDHSGGNPRDLIRLLDYAFQDIDGEMYTLVSLQTAIRRLATDYRRILHQDDYALLANIDRNPKEYAPVNADTRRLLYNLALLEYNQFWWQSHPVIRTLAAYQEAISAPTQP